MIFVMNELEKYYEMLVEKNKVMNLTGITEENEVYEKHFDELLSTASAEEAEELGISFSKYLSFLY